MSRYFVTAWCERPFYAQCEVEAETPQEALAKAREAIHDAPTEECDHGYCWDEWRIDTADEEGVLLHLDEPARIRAAAPRLLHACRMVVARWEKGDLAEAARACQSAIAQATGPSPSKPHQLIIIAVLGGVVQDVLNVPPGFKYEVKDYDDLNDAASTDAGSAA